MNDKSAFIPNSYQTPNAYLDDCMAYLTGEEWKVLSYAIRRILGFQKRQDHISISQFTDGIKDNEGNALDNGTGLSGATVSKCLKNLVAFRLMVKVGKNDPKINDGDLWSLQWDSKKVNMKALKDRAESKNTIYSDRMNKARSMRHTPHNGIENPPHNGIERTTPNGIETQNTGDIQGKPYIKPSAEKSAKPPTPPEVKLFREVTQKYPQKVNFDGVANLIKGVSKRLQKDCSADDLRPFYEAWCANGWNPTNLAWLAYAERGEIPTPQGKQGNYKPRDLIKERYGGIMEWAKEMQENEDNLSRIDNHNGKSGGGIPQLEAG